MEKILPGAHGRGRDLGHLLRGQLQRQRKPAPPPGQRGVDHARAGGRGGRRG